MKWCSDGIHGLLGVVVHEFNDVLEAFRLDVVEFHGGMGGGDIVCVCIYICMCVCAIIIGTAVVFDGVNVNVDVDGILNETGDAGYPYVKLEQLAIRRLEGD